MSDVNQFNCTCGVVTEPELSFVGTNQTPLCRYRVGVEDYKNKSQYFTVKAWNKIGETQHQHLKVGKKIFLSGRLVIETWESKDGETRFDPVIYAETFNFLSNGKPKDDTATTKKTESSESSESPESLEKPEDNISDNSNLETAGVSIDSDEDIPF